MKKHFVQAIRIAAAGLFCFAAAEGACRLFPADHPLFFKYSDERSLVYRYDSELGWFPEGGRTSVFEGARTIRVENNADGFRDVAHGPKTRPRIAFVGDSFVWGYDAEVSERFTDRLQALIPGWEVLNLGVSGYGTDQQYLMLQKFFDRYQPDIVCLVFFAGNDREDNTSNRRYSGYYKPYFTVAGGGLEPHGVPVPRSVNYFYREYPLLFKSRAITAAAKLLDRAAARIWPGRREVRVPDPSEELVGAMRRLAESRGGSFVLALVQSDPVLEAYADRNSIPHVQVGNPFRYNTHGGHWTPLGNEYVCRKIYEFLAGRYRWI